MDKVTEDKFKALFKKRAEGDQRAKSDQERQRQTQRDNQRRYLEHVSQVIKPALESMSAFFAQQGVRSRVQEAPDGPGVEDLLNIKIGLYVQTDDARLSRNSDPSEWSTGIEFSFSAPEGKIGLYETSSNRGAPRSRGPAGKFEIEEVDAAFIQARMLNLMGG
jgi:hypothetical protein